MTNIIKTKRKLVKVTKGIYKGEVGFAEACLNNNIFFYPLFGETPYRFCLRKDQVSTF